MILGLDCDGVLADLVPYWLDCYNIDFDDNLAAEDCTSWETHTVVKPECGTRIYDYLQKPGFFRNVPVIAGAREGVDRLIEMGHDILIVTAVPPHAVQERLDWLREHFPSLKPKNYVVTQRKDVVSLDLLVDDSPHNVRAARCPYILFDQPYNQGEPGLRARDWQELVSLIESFSKDRNASA